MSRMAIVLVLLVTGCAATKAVVRSVNDIARQLCELTAAESGDKLGMTPEEWCAVRENLDPFIREVTSAQSAASEKSGLTPSEEPKDAGGS